MKTISMTLENGMLKELDSVVKKKNYGTRTEFIRESIRKNLTELEREEAIKKFLNFRMRKKPGVTDEDFEKLREEAFWELAKEKGILRNERS